MAKLALVKGATSQTVQVFIQNSSSTTGAGLTGLVFNTASLVAYYARPRAAAVAITLATQTVTGAFSSGGFVEIDATNMPGWYRLDLPDAVLATGVDHVGVHLKGAANMAPLPLEIQLTNFDLNDADPDVNVVKWLGTAAATPTVAGVPEVDVTHWIGTAAATPTVAGVPEVDITHFNGTAGTFAAGRPEVNTSHVGGTLQTAGDIMADTNDIQARLPAALVGGRIDASVGAVAANAITAASLAADASTEIRSLASGTADSGTTTTMVDAARTEADTDYWKGCILVITSGTLLGQSRNISAFNAATDTITVDRAFTQAVGTHTYEIWPAVDTAALAAAVDAVDNFVDTEITDIQNRLPAALVSGRMDASVGAMAADVVTAAAVAANAIGASELAADAATEVAAAVWDKARADHTTAGTFGQGAASVQGNVTGSVGSVTGAVGSVTAGVTLAASAVQAIWDALTSALTTVGSIGKRLADNIDVVVSTRATPAQVNTEVVDALNVDTYAEPAQGAPAATATLAAKINYLYKNWRNRKTQTSTVWSLYNDDAVTVDHKATVADDNTTASKTEITTGP